MKILKSINVEKESWSILKAMAAQNGKSLGDMFEIIIKNVKVEEIK